MATIEPLQVDIVVEGGYTECAPKDGWLMAIPNGRRFLKLLIGGRTIFSAEIVPTTERWHGK